MWYGWIPILSSELMPQAAIDLIISSSQPKKPFGQTQTFLYTPKATISQKEQKYLCNRFDDNVLNDICEGLEVTDEHRVFCYLKMFDDLQGATASQRVSFSVFSDGRIDRVSIHTSEDPMREEIHAQIYEIDDSGLVEFDLIRGLLEEGKEIFANQVFAIIRDIYHKHVYASYTDFALFPVEAVTKSKALDKIRQQYDLKIIDYHTHIKQLLKRRDDLEKWDKATEKELYESIASGSGEMIYGESFLNLLVHAEEFSEEDGVGIFPYTAAIKAVDQSRRSLENLCTHARCETAALEFRTAKRLSEKVTFLTAALLSLGVVNASLALQRIGENRVESIVIGAITFALIILVPPTFKFIWCLMSECRNDS